MNKVEGKLLYVSNNKRGLLFNNKAFYEVDFTDGRKDMILSVHLLGLKSVLSYSRLATRLLRIEPRCVERLDENRFVICYQRKVWLLDVEAKTFIALQESRQGFSNPLNLCSDGRDIYWGDYGDNAGCEEVNVYRLNPDLKIEVVYSFSQGTIRHIHNLVWDGAHNRFFILTGDLEATSGIYTATADWHEVIPVVTGKQKYRAVVGFPYNEGLIYATDSVAEENNIYLLHGGEVKPLCPFPGSCIYGAEVKTHYVFASTVEPSEGRGFFDMFTYELGAGITDKYSHLITIRKSDLHVEEVLKVKKDIWPMKLFQYGSLMFPKMQEESEDLWYYVMACKGDGKTFKLI